MQISDLIIIGRLGNIVNDKNEYQFNPNNNFQPIIFEKNATIFVLINSDRLRFASFSFREEAKK